MAKRTRKKGCGFEEKNNWKLWVESDSDGGFVSYDVGAFRAPTSRGDTVHIDQFDHGGHDERGREGLSDLPHLVVRRSTLESV